MSLLKKDVLRRAVCASNRLSKECCQNVAEMSTADPMAHNVAATAIPHAPPDASRVILYKALVCFTIGFSHCGGSSTPDTVHEFDSDVKCCRDLANYRPLLNYTMQS